MTRLLLCLLLLRSALVFAHGEQRPNILFLFSDDQRADSIASLGNASIRTPALDRLVKTGTAFTRAYCMGANQGAVCVPSRAMLMTGRSLFRIQEQLQDQDTWPEAFARAGYSTFITGKWHNGAPSVLRAFQQGKAVFLGGMGDPYRLKIQDIDSTDRTFKNQRISGEHCVKVFADQAAAFLDGQRGKPQPFLCYVAFNAPHDPRVAPKELHERYHASPPPLPANFLPQHPFNNGALVIRDEELAPWPRTSEIVRQHLADYYAAIEFLDAQIGRILTALENAGKLDTTIIVFSSDHGLAIGSHGLFGKQNLYDHSMRAPLIITGPGLARDQRSDALCYLFDIFPTLGQIAGVPNPAGSEGRNLLPILKGEAKTHREVIFTAYTKSQRAIRDGRWKVIRYPQISKTQLFDLDADPEEKHDLSTDPKYAGELQRLTDRLREEQSAAHDHLPLTADQQIPAEFDFSKVKREIPNSGKE
jgi:arylsulfatase A-like enzyme